MDGLITPAPIASLERELVDLRKHLAQKSATVLRNCAVDLGAQAALSGHPDPDRSASFVCRPYCGGGIPVDQLIRHRTLRKKAVLNAAFPAPK